jgi:hypothetical protein
MSGTMLAVSVLLFVVLVLRLSSANRRRPFETLRAVSVEEALSKIKEQYPYAYPYADFHRDLSEKSQRSLKTQYEKALREGEMVIFVRDNEQKRLVSFSVVVE